MPDIPPGVGHGLPDILVSMMLQRKVDIKKMDQFLYPKLNSLKNPFLLPDMQKAVDRLFQAIDAGEKICVYGDYDVDGITSVTLMTEILESYGGKVSYFIPRRGPEGYGLNEAAVKRCMQECGKPDLLITVDCGTGSLKEIEQLQKDGVDVIVVDHHEIPSQGKPQCVAVVNPKCSDGEHCPFDYLCAAGVVFKLSHALLKTRKITGFDLKDYLDLVAMATVADIVPLVEENRLLVRHGLRIMESTRHPGVRALMDAAQVKGPLTSADVGFRIGPRINAAGRMDRPEDALATLKARTKEEAERWASRLDSHNRERQKEELKINQSAMDQVEKTHKDDPVIVIGSRDWHPGVVGIVASRLMRRFHKPAFVIAIDKDGMGKGSGRSIGGVSLMQAINANRDCLEAGGGHAMAAGISVHEDSIDTFRDGFSKFVQENVSEEDRLPRLYIDVEIEFSMLSLDFLDSYELLQPFGQGNPQPVFMSRNVYLTAPPRELKNHHLKLSMKQGDCWRDAMFFGAAERELPPQPWDIAFTINRNVFRNQTNLQIVIQDIRTHRKEG